MKSIKMFSGIFVLVLVIAGIIVSRGLLLNGFRSAKTLVHAFFDRSFTYQAFLSLQTEHRGLLAQLRARGGGIGEDFPGDTFSYLRADVFSRYPFNDRQLLTLNVGTDQGVSEGMPVVAREHVLIGKIRSVRRTQSEVETIQNPSWRSSVVLGPDRVQAVFRGGIPPRVELIPAGVEVRESDEVSSISPEFPFGLFLGTIASLDIDPKTLWQSGEVTLSYGGIDQLNSVFVIVDFP